jgi:hypothetical protein
MKFALINASGDVAAVFKEHKPALEAYEEVEDSNWRCSPIMTLDEFNKTHTDFRGLLQGRPSVIYLDSVTGGTVLNYVYLIEAWDAYQVWSGMKYKDYIVPEQQEVKSNVENNL